MIGTAFADARSKYTVDDGELSKNNTQTQTTLTSHYPIHTQLVLQGRPKRHVPLLPEPDAEDEPSRQSSKVLNRLDPPQTPAWEPSQAPIWSPSPALPRLPQSPERASTSTTTRSIDLKPQLPLPPTHPISLSRPLHSSSRSRLAPMP